MKVLHLFLLSTLLVSPLIYADAPVYDSNNQLIDNQGGGANDSYYEDNNQNPPANDQANDQSYQRQAGPPLSLEDRVAKLEGQVNYQNQQNASSQISNLQQEIQSLRGQIEVQANDLNKLRQQQQALAQNAVQAPAAKPTPPKTNTIASKKTDANQNIQNNQDNAQDNPDDNQSAAAGDNEPASDIAPSGVAASPQKTGFLSDQNAYQKGYDQLKAKQYTQATSSFQSYVKQYPKGQYAANAHFWLGQLLLMQNNTQGAIAELQTVINDFPTNSKASDAMLKLGLIYNDQGQIHEAKEQLLKVKSKYPGTSAAQLAATRLREINSQNSD